MDLSHVAREPAHALSQHPRGEVHRPLRLGKDHEPGVVRNQMQAPELLLGQPPNPLIARAQLERPGLPADERKPALAHPDQTMRRRLRGESPRILGWGLSAPHEQPECPREFIEARESYRHEVAPSLDWFTEYVQADRHPDAFVPSGELRASYAAWCQAADEPQMVPAAFNLAMREAFPHSERVRRRVEREGGGDARPWGWTGVRLVPLSDG